MYFQIIDEIKHKEVVAIGKSIHEISRLRKIYGDGKWRKMKGITRVRFSDKTNHRLKKEMQQKIVICINNQGYEVSLERWKVYRIIPDEKVGIHNQIRVVDESGEDYVYPEEYFTPIELPKPVQQALITTT